MEENFAQFSDKRMETEDYFNQFLFMVYFVNPTKDHCRVILDDGSIKFYVKRDKFLDLMSKIFNEILLKDSQYLLYRIKRSLTVYGGSFFIDKVNLDFRELSERVDLEHIKPQELIDESRRSLVKDKLTKDFHNVGKEYQENVLNKFTFQEAKKTFNTFFNTFRTIKK